MPKYSVGDKVEYIGRNAGYGTYCDVQKVNDDGTCNVIAHCFGVTEEALMVWWNVTEDKLIPLVVFGDEPQPNTFTHMMDAEV